MKKTTRLLYSSTGLSALIAGLVLTENSPQELPRLWHSLTQPGQFLSLEQTYCNIICFNCGAAAPLVRQLITSAQCLWQGQHISAQYVPEGPLARLRGLLFCKATSLMWLLSPELRYATELNEWK